MKEITRHTKILDHNPKLPYLVCYQNHPMCIDILYVAYHIYRYTEHRTNYAVQKAFMTL